MTRPTIAAAQIPSAKGDVAANVLAHVHAMHAAHRLGVDLVVFPELSLTGYEPELAARLAFARNDARLAPLREAAAQYGMHAIAGAPLLGDGLPQIGAFVVSPDGTVSSYTKIHLHPGEERHFAPGTAHSFLDIGDTRIAVAVCADTNSDDHARQCAKHGAQVYAAGVFVTSRGYAADTARLQEHAHRHGMLVVMANHNRPGGGLSSIGGSAIWSPDGRLAAANETQDVLVVARHAAGDWTGRVVEL